MILQCPACNARYTVPDNAVGASGRSVRCAKCAHEWFAAAPEAPPPPPKVDPDLEALLNAPETPVEEKPTKLPKKNVPASAKSASPVLTGVFAASALFALLATMFHTKPNWFGLGKTHNITLSDLALAKQVVEGTTEYAVSGKLINTSNAPIKPPQVRITLVDNEGNALQFWEPNMPEKIEANDPLPFTFGPLKHKFTRADRLVVELGNSLELALRDKP